MEDNLGGVEDCRSDGLILLAVGLPVMLIGLIMNIMKVRRPCWRHSAIMLPFPLRVTHMST